ncbi:Thioesterase/thiol ester dehydrase-isomerase [Conidiobolus coronatus NRRL 28638]|uniref:Thioesterase/thiol ester dehydrase-isomerase n=1 Tax=Conidiobolus coronatus (strain ATCC 28846 / CBS 209.66 / NRRL 28638) TaxID=796925 RepID=A0A137NX64_CONC2|nr:Thioesterase/thiol ester dehydrase-isomerase [Conidiobolus coronatus NRRL 28638]|eukprot:KXN67395.1 Thioesterase/thiol ester dehydrase-isomerase [Conidiobolus coronatus NRRL 28638]
MNNIIIMKSAGVFKNNLRRLTNPARCTLSQQIRSYTCSNENEHGVYTGKSQHKTSLFNSMKVTKPWNKGENIASKQVVKPKFEEKRMIDSYTEVLLPFKTDSELLGQYENFFGVLKVGKFIEDLDCMAATIAYKHCNVDDVETAPFYLVTASVDSLVLIKELDINKNYRIFGNVNYVGFSSIEVMIKVEPYEEGEEDLAPRLAIESSDRPYNLLSTFTMVALDKFTRKPSQVNPLKADNELEKKVLKLGEASKEKKKKLKSTSLAKIPPTNEERLIIHDKYLESLKYKENKPDNVKYMEQTVLNSSLMCHPQNRNIYGFMFGGFLMREALEHAWITAYMFCKENPTIVRADEIVFKQSVPVGAILKFISKVIYSEGYPDNEFQVAVEAWVIGPDLSNMGITDTFHYTFKSRTKQVPKVIPRTYEESIQLLEGKRRKDRRGQLPTEL